MKALIECPYCECEINLDSENWPQNDGDKVVHLCEECGQSFLIHLEISYDLYPNKADCLNGSEHTYSEIPFETDCNFIGDDGKTYTKFREHTCKICGYTKKEFS
jgi:hypothetical protein